MTKKNVDVGVDLKELVGIHRLSGVDEYVEKRPHAWRSAAYDDAKAIRFRLDGKTYTAIEDPEDGYRSSMSSLVRNNDRVTNTFAPIVVRGVLNLHSDRCANDMIDFYNVRDETVLSIGTANTDDYYPWFVASFWPEHVGKMKDGGK